jgi:lipopolysaccharide assembly outer membrane protein LptD (OstA)
MDMKIFTSILLVLALGAYFYPVENLKMNTLDKDIPMVIFEDSVMYTLNEENVNRVVVASHAIKYQDRDEMFNADVILRNNDKSKNFNNEKLKADLIVKKADIYTLTDNVNYRRDDFIKLDTDELIYDYVNKTAQNSKPFKSVYYKHILDGDSVFLDINNEFITAKNTHFEIDVTKNEKGKK